MKLTTVAFILSGLFATSSRALWAPSCSWNSCMNAWNGPACSSSSGWDCVCTNATAIAQINTCVATSCTNVTDQEAVYAAIAQICADNGNRVTNSQQATFSATSGGTLSALATATGWGSGGRWAGGDWSSWISQCSAAIGSAPTGWNGNGPWGNGYGNGHGGWGGNNWGTWASNVNCASWTTWTAGWGPYSSWTGTWSGCSSTTNSPLPATITTTVTAANGATNVLVGTTFGIQAAVSATGTAGSGTGTTNNSATSVDTTIFGICGVLAVTVFTLMIVL